MTSISNPAIWLAGYIPDIPTPFDERGAVDLAAFGMLCERQIDAGVAASGTATFRPLDASIVSDAIPAFFIGRNTVAYLSHFTH